MTGIIIQIVLALAAIVIVCISYYISIKKLIQEEALKAINIAEEMDTIGEQKMAIAIELVYAVLPAVAKTFITKDMIKMTIQAVFDQVEEYAQKQAGKKNNK